MTATDYLLGVGDLIGSLGATIVKYLFTPIGGVYWFGILFICVLFLLFLRLFLHKD